MKNDFLVLVRLEKYAVVSIRLASVLLVAVSKTGIFVCVYKSIAAVGRGKLFKELPMHFMGTVVTSCGQADGGEENCAKLGRWTLCYCLWRCACRKPVAFVASLRSSIKR